MKRKCSIERRNTGREGSGKRLDWSGLMDSLEIMSNSIQGITRICEAVDVFKEAGKDCDLGRGNLV